MKRIVPGLVLLPLVVEGLTASSEAPPRRLFEPDPVPSANGILRTTPETTWVQVHLPGESPCPAQAAGGAHTLEEVWCFEGVGGDSTWPANPPASWNHWSKYDPPEGQPSKWHVTTLWGGPSTGTYNAWGGCDGMGTNPDCDTEGWGNPDGYGNDWNYPLVLDCRQEDASAGGTLRFDLRYDCELNYDYIFLEYEATPGTWEVLHDELGTPSYWSGLNPFQPFWRESRTFDFPARDGGARFRWRAYSDLTVSDESGEIATRGIAAIDNVVVTFTASGSVVSDDFETGDFEGIVSSEAFSRWQPLDGAGNPYDGWHLGFMPDYVNQGADTTFVDDWMWAAKPAGVSIPENGFDFFLVTPAIDVSGWAGGLVEYDVYLCAYAKKEDYTNELVRTWDTAHGWSLWNDFDGYITFEGCEFWARDERQSLTPYLGSDVDSLQLAWEILDLSASESLSWGKHGGVQYLIDHVSVGRIEEVATPAPVASPLPLALMPASPSPFRDETVIRWELPRRMEVTLAIYDVAGRKVRTLVDGPRGPGTGVKTWAARTDAGQRVSAGIYFARMSVPGFEATRKIVVLP